MMLLTTYRMVVRAGSSACCLFSRSCLHNTPSDNSNNNKFYPSFPPVKTTRSLSNTTTPPPKTLSQKLKRYGISFVLLDFCTWTMTVSTFFFLYSIGVEMVTILDFVEQMIDVAYWADVFGVPVKSLTGDKAALSLALVSATITFPIRFFIDLVILVVLNRIGIIHGPKQSS